LKKIDREFRTALVACRVPDGGIQMIVFLLALIALALWWRVRYLEGACAWVG
jgi:hypothetical protein